MRINVSGLLRDFARVRRAALAGETVIITTRDGNLVLTAERAAAEDLFGSLADRIVSSDEHLDRPTLADEEWRPAV